MKLIKVVSRDSDARFDAIPFRKTCPRCEKRWDELGVGEVRTVSCTRCGDSYLVEFEEGAPA